MLEYGLVPYCRQAQVWPKAIIYLWHKATYDIAMTQDTPSRSLDKVIVRLPDGMRDQIKAHAEANNRSMNAEIVSLLSVAMFEADIARMSQGYNPLREMTEKDHEFMKLFKKQNERIARIEEKLSIDKNTDSPEDDSIF